jgi:hypothetical protein
MDREMLKMIEEWALGKSPLLSMNDYSRGFHDGIEHAKGIVLAIMKEVEETY